MLKKRWFKDNYGCVFVRYRSLEGCWLCNNIHGALGMCHVHCEMINRRLGIGYSVVPKKYAKEKVV